MNNTEKEIKQLNEMMDYLGRKMEKLPLRMQLEIMQAYIEFAEKLKPVYVSARLMNR